MRLFKHYCGIKRSVALGSNGRRQKETISVANRCLFLPMPQPKELENGFAIGSGYDCYFEKPDQDVAIGDQLIRNGKVYNVRAVHRYEVPIVGHVHALCTQEGV